MKRVTPVSPPSEMLSGTRSAPLALRSEREKKAPWGIGDLDCRFRPQAEDGLVE
jgi:hypothetical protein